jgi:hypothetical protein
VLRLVVSWLDHILNPGVNLRVLEFGFSLFPQHCSLRLLVSFWLVGFGAEGGALKLLEANKSQCRRTILTQVSGRESEE